MNKQWIKFLIGFLIIVIFVGVFGYLLEAWSGFPKGADAYARITRIVYILDFFPNVFWQYHWANGMPMFTSEAPLFYFLGAILAKILFLSPEKPLYIIGFLTFVFIGLGIFGYVVTFTRKFTAGILAAILALSSFSLWSWMISGGIYPRIFSVGLSMIALWQAARFLVALKHEEVFPRGKFVLAVFSLAATMTAHVLMSFFAWAAIFFILLSFPLPFKSKVKYGLALYLASFFLAGFFFFPVVFGFGGSSSHFIGVISEVIPALIYYFYEFVGIGPFILPILPVIFLLVILLARSKKEGEFGLFTLLFMPLLMFVIFSIYALIGYTGLPGRYYYVNGFIPLSATLFITIYGSILIGLLFGRLETISKRVVPGLGIVLMLVIALSSIFIGIPLIKNDDRMINVNNTGVSGPKNDVYALQQILKFPEEDFNHRFAAYDASEAVWFNVSYKIPQVRDYYGQGILYPDWRYWFEQAVWDPKKFSIDEARAAFDWYAVKWFSAYENNPGIHVYEVMQDNPEAARKNGGVSVDEFLAKSTNRYFREPGFKFVSYGRIHYDGLQEEFEVENPSPILSAVNTPAVFFIGDPKNYNLLFSNLTFGNYSSQKIIPVRGKKYIDDYKLSDLTGYETILLYGYKYHDPKRAAKLLSDYLSQGGNIVWEQWDAPEIPDIAPFSSIEISQIDGGVWDFMVVPDPLTDGIKFDFFAPPLYNNTPWKIATAKTDSLKPGAKILLSSGEKPLLTIESVGKGKIVWTGFNFLYHVNAYNNLDEAKLLYKILDSLVVAGDKPTAQAATFINPQLREITTDTPVKGVLFKESYYPNWQAYSVDAGGKRKNLKIQLAGPGVMYTSLGSGVSFPAKVVFQYRFSLVEKLGFIFSLTSLILLLGYALKFSPVERIFSRLGKRSNPVINKTQSWWDDEEA